MTNLRCFGLLQMKTKKTISAISKKKKMVMKTVKTTIKIIMIRVKKVSTVIECTTNVELN